MTVELISGVSRGADHPAASPRAASAKQECAVRTPSPAANRPGGYVRCTSLPQWRRSPVPDVVRRHERRRGSGFRGGGKVLGFAAALLLGGLALTATAQATAPARLTFTMVRVGSPGNRAVGIIPFQDAIFRSCSVAPKTRAGCLNVGSVGYRYDIGELEVTVAQWVGFLNTVDSLESSSAWPRFGEINFVSRARPGFHYRVAYAEWADKPYGFATGFVRAARFVNSLTNGKVLSRRVRRSGGFSFVTFTVRLSRQTERGMYDLARPNATRDRKRGFVVPSQNEWIKAAYFDPRGGGTFSYWKYPTNPGVFFTGGTGDAPTAAMLDPHTGDVTNAATQPLASYKPSNGSAPYWCPSQVSATDCQTVNPFGLDPATYAALYQGSLCTVGQARTRSPWGTLDQGGNAVEWTDTITAPPPGLPGRRVWRRLHGGVSNAGAYQMWISAVGLQPEDHTYFPQTYPWLGFRIGYIG